MKKIEQVFREILYQAMENKNRVLTQLGLSKKLGLSLSIVNLAIKKLEKMNSIRIRKMNFQVIDVKKILYLWASIRNVEGGVVYQTRVEMPVREIERNLPEVTFAGYSAYKLTFDDVPADYSEVYVYADELALQEIKRRFPFKERNPNLFVLRKDGDQETYGRTGTLAQIFVDLWNLKQWYAQDFLKALEGRMHSILEQ